MSKQTINVALDIETLSMRPTAAIIEIAAQSFSFSGNQPIDNEVLLHLLVNASTCAMYGFHFDMETVNWWASQPDDVKCYNNDLTSASYSIKGALLSLKYFIDDLKRKYPDSELLVWCQGTDFDIPILRNAYKVVLGTDAPWPHDCVRDARTFIHSVYGLCNKGNDNPYDLIPKNPDWQPHNPLSDCKQLIWNVRHVIMDFAG